MLLFHTDYSPIINDFCFSNIYSSALLAVIPLLQKSDTKEEHRLIPYLRKVDSMVLIRNYQPDDLESMTELMMDLGYPNGYKR
jgi:hypothetical protein